MIGVNGIQDALVANLALRSETNEAADERIRRVGPSPPPHVVGIENLESPITLPSPLLPLSPLPSFLSLCFPLSSRSPPPPASSSSFAQTQSCAQYNAPSCARRNYKLFSIWPCTRHTYLDYYLLFIATLLFCCCRRLVT